MIPLLTFPIQIDKKTWETFKARAKQEGLTAKAVIYRFIEYFINHGLPPEPPKKKDPK
jgi:hypothetical protein